MRSKFWSVVTIVYVEGIRVSESFPGVNRHDRRTAQYLNSVYKTTTFKLDFFSPLFFMLRTCQKAGHCYV